MYQSPNKTTIAIRPGKYPHTGWVDLRGTGVWTEVAIMSVDGGGSIHFFPLADLDAIDRRRFLNVVSSRQASSFPLYDLMANQTLGNGVNALVYFQQLVKVLTPSRQIIAPRVGVVGGLTQSVPAPEPTTVAAAQA